MTETTSTSTCAGDQVDDADGPEDRTELSTRPDGPEGTDTTATAADATVTADHAETAGHAAAADDAPEAVDDAPEAERAPAAGAEGKPAAGGQGGSGGRSADLFHESEVAADYVEGLLDILDLDGDIDELVVAGRPMVEVIEGGSGEGRRLQSLVGTRGATLEALQELARLAVYRQTGAPSRLLLDVGGYRTARRKELSAIAKNAAEQVKEHGEAIKMEPMSAFERKCVHDVINATPGVESESEGTEPGRRIVVRPTN